MSYFQIFIIIFSTISFSYFIYYSSDTKVKNPLDNLFSAVTGQLVKPIFVIASAAGTLSTPSVCCEKTKSGASCINTDASECAALPFKQSPTSCESTSYCKLGTCYDSQEGICMENTPQIVCNANGGTWDSKSSDQLPQCQLGCCVIADQAAFVPLVRCKRLSSIFGVAMDYRKNIDSEISCIATAQSQDTGACVYEKDFATTCKFQTRAECNAAEGVVITNGTNSSSGSEKKFYKDYLCSAEELNTDCAKQATTGCYQQKVYWLDSCGNRENVYSSDKIKSWNNGKVLEADLICGANDGSNKDCGNCDYFLGSRCAVYEKGIVSLGKPTFGNNYCQKTVCKDSAGNERKNGESWCVYDSKTGNGTDAVGSRQFKETCVDGKVIVEACADYRQGVCIQGSVTTSDVTGFSAAGCRVNRWQDCITQTKKTNCENTDRRDCMWLPSIPGLNAGVDSGLSKGQSSSNPASSSGTFTNPTSTSMTGKAIADTNAPITGNALFGGDDEEKTEETESNRANGICVPNVPPGLKFWDEGEAQSICGQASAKCIVTFEKKLIGSEKCVENCECLEDGWAKQANQICTAMGDCGGYVNYVGKYTEDGYEWKVDGKEKKFSPNDINKLKISSGATGNAILGITGNAVGNSVTTITPIKTSGIFGNSAPKMATYSGKLTENGLTKLTSNFQSTTNGNVLEAGKGFTMAQQADGTYLITGEGASGSTTLTAAQASEFATSQGLQIQTLTANQATLAQWAGTTTGTWQSALLGGLQWGAIAFGLGYLAGSMFGMTKKNSMALGLALGGGAFVYETLASSNAFINAVGANYQIWAGVAGIGVAAAIFIMMYSKESTQVVTFKCQPWQPPRGGNDCEKCNSDILPCSEYRCKALGGSCDIVNAGTDQEKCVNINPKDVEPPTITPEDKFLTSGYKYTDIKLSPPGPGFRIINTNGSNECVKAFTPLVFGITTNEPAQCKIDFNSTTKMNDMQYWFGGSNLYLLNHTENMVLPGPNAKENGSLILQNGGKWTFFIRCSDKNGNENSAEYALRFCVDPSPDTTAPEIRATSISNGACVAENKNDANVDFYTNEPADCRWSKDDKAYENMENQMICQNAIYQLNALQLYTCTANLTGIAKTTTDFYVRCKDQPSGIADNDRNINKQSYKYSLIGSDALKIKNLMPNGTVYGATRPASVELSVETLFGCDNGKAICFYSTTDDDGDYVQFFNTEDILHTQRQDVSAGQSTYYIKCVDSGGNVAKNSTIFNMEIDTNAPVVARVYEEDKMLKLVTVRNSECSYSFNNCDFSFKEGTAMPYANSTNHVTEWKTDKTYYIKCRDEFRGEPADCSIIVKPYKKFI